MNPGEVMMLFPKNISRIYIGAINQDDATISVLPSLESGPFYTMTSKQETICVRIRDNAHEIIVANDLNPHYSRMLKVCA